MSQVPRTHSPVILGFCIMIEIDQVFVLDLYHRRSLRPIARERFARFSEWSMRLFSHGIAQVLFQRLLPFIFEEQVELALGLKHGGVNGIETGVVKEARLGERFKIARRGVIKPMIITIIAGVVGFRKFARDGAGPEEQPAVFPSVVKDFWRPDIARARLVLHYWDRILFG